MRLCSATITLQMPSNKGRSFSANSGVCYPPLEVETPGPGLRTLPHQAPPGQGQDAAFSYGHLSQQPGSKPHTNLRSPSPNRETEAANMQAITCWLENKKISLFYPRE